MSVKPPVVLLPLVTGITESSFPVQALLTDFSPSASTPASSISPPPPTTNPCPAGYISWYQNCYKLVEEPKAWEEAQVACEQEGGNLASIDMSYDQAFIAGVVIQGKADAWIGLRRKVLSAGRNAHLHIQNT